MINGTLCQLHKLLPAQAEGLGSDRIFQRKAGAEYAAVICAEDDGVPCTYTNTVPVFPGCRPIWQKYRAGLAVVGNARHELRHALSKTQSALNRYKLSALPGMKKPLKFLDANEMCLIWYTPTSAEIYSSLLLL